MAPASTIHGSAAGTPARDSTWAAATRLLRFAIGVGPRAFALTVATALAGSLAEGAGLENEERILDAILDAIRDAGKNHGEHLTVLMIAHRSSAVCRADRIFELEDGCIARSRALYDTEVEVYA